VADFSEASDARVVRESGVAIRDFTVVTYSVATDYLREKQFDSANVPSPAVTTSLHHNESDQVILTALEAKSTHHQHTIVYKRLMQSFWFVPCHLRWIPHLPSRT
jgi:hypothetical protein